MLANNAEISMNSMHYETGVRLTWRKFDEMALQPDLMSTDPTGYVIILSVAVQNP